ncbi:MAG: response regulator [Geopsychrobacter sp.]|nr:response regulator [Geopsychrobacter sp.]
MKILCVDDEKNVLKSLNRLFRLAGYETVTALSAREALKILSDDASISLVLSDYEMPQENGVTFLRVVHQYWPEIGRVLLTGHADKQEVRKAVADREIQRCVKKPWKDDELLFIANRWLGEPSAGIFVNLCT